MIKRCLSILLVIVMVMLPLAGCENGSSQSSSTTTGTEKKDYPLFIGDLQIEAMPRAVISLSPATTEMLFHMGYEDRVMGISEFCDYPSKALTKMRCGSAMGIDKEVIALRPCDLVVTSTPLLEKELIWFQQQNIPVLVLPRGNSWEEIKANYINLAIVMSGEVSGKEYGETYYAILENKLEYGKTRGNDFLTTNPPLRGALLRQMDYTMATGETFEQQIFDHLQIVNEGASYTGWMYPVEKVVELEPDVIFCDSSIAIDDVKNSAIYKPVKAVTNDKIMQVDFTILDRQTPRMFELMNDMVDFAYGLS